MLLSAVLNEIWIFNGGHGTETRGEGGNSEVLTYASDRVQSTIRAYWRHLVHSTRRIPLGASLDFLSNNE